MAGFKDFILRGNVVDLAVGVIIGTAFGKIVGSVTEDLIMPLIAQVGGKHDFSDIVAGPLKIGNLLNATISFLITASVVYFIIVKPFQVLMARLYPPPPPGAPPAPPPDIQLLTEIRDLLKSRA